MAGRGVTSFLKRQKEQQRVARANAKRADRQARRENRAAQRTVEPEGEEWNLAGPADGVDAAEAAAPEPGTDEAAAE